MPRRDHGHEVSHHISLIVEVIVTDEGGKQEEMIDMEVVEMKIADPIIMEMGT